MTERRIAVLDETGKLPTDVLPTPMPIQVVEGAEGKSAYEVAVENGFVGTEVEWLASLATGGPHDHDADYAPTAHDHDYAPIHDHPYAATAHAHDYADPAHTHALSQHALDGASHSGTEVLPTPGQKNALAGTQGTPGLGNPYVTNQDARLADARTPTAHAHADADIPAGIARDAEVTAAVSAHAALADPHPGYLTPAEANTAYEASGAIAAHAAAANPHATYATDADLTAHAATQHGGSTAPVHATLANGATDMALGVNDSVKVTPTANATYTSAVPVAGSRRTILVLTSGTTSRTITFGTGFKAAGTLATGTTAARIFAISFISDGTSLYETGRTAAIVA